MLDSSADDRNPVLPFIPVIDEALGRLRYFPICHQRGLLHSSEIVRLWSVGLLSAAQRNVLSGGSLPKAFPDRSEHVHFEA
jgi:hypothetical protein